MDRACWSPWGCKELDMTEQLNWTESRLPVGKKQQYWKPLMRYGGLNLFSITSVINYHKFSNLAWHKLSYSSWGQKRKMATLDWNLGVSQSAFLMENLEKNPFQCFSISWRLSASPGSSALLCLQISIPPASLFHLSGPSWLQQSNPASVQLSNSVVSDSLRPRGLQHSRFPSPLLSPRVCSNSCPLSWWCHPAILFSATPFCSCLQTFPPSGKMLCIR